MPATISEAPARVAVSEARAFVEAATPAQGPGRLLIRLISAGRGSSGVYPPETLKAAAEARVFRKGTHMHINHQTDTEAYERPEGDLFDMAAVLTEDARWDETNQALVAEARVYSRFRTMLAEMAPDIGVSIRAMADAVPGEWDGEPARIISRITEAITVDFVTLAGRGGAIVQVLEAGRKVREARNVGQWFESRIHRDFTTTADETFGDGRLTREERIALSSAIGDALDAFVARLEQAAPQLYGRDLWDEPPGAPGAAVEAAKARGVAEATVNDMRERLQDLVADAYRIEDRQYAWVRDFDATTVWFELSGTETNGVFQQAYTSDDDGMPTELTGEPIEVLVRTTYEPVAAEARKPTHSDASPAPVSEAAPAAEPNPPAVEAGSTPPHKEEDPMGTIQVDEARYAGLEEKAALVPALEARAEAAEQRAEEAEQRALQAEAGTKARDFARTVVTKANADLAEASVAKIVRDALAAGPLPLDENGRLDTEAFTPTITEAREAEETYLAQVAEASGIGSVRGVGPTVKETDADLSDTELDEALAKLSGRPIKEA